jgi:cysteinyl-tRNA synthetase
VGNIQLLHAALEAYGRDALVMYFAGGHYRQPLVYSEDALEDARAAVERVRNFWMRLDGDGHAPAEVEDYAERFFDALADDFNTPAARAVLFDWIQEGNKRLDAGERLGPGRLPEMLHALGLESLTEEQAGPGQEAERLAAERQEARAAGDYGRADELRDRLAEMGFEVRDTADGPRLVRRD